MPHPEDDSAARSLIEAGSAVAGSTVGAAVGLLVAGSPGALAGAAGGPLVERALRWAAVEFRRRSLGPRQEARVGGAIAYAAERVQTHRAAGRRLRSDGFFQADTTGRAAAEEVAEAVLVAAQAEHEEKKLRHYGRLLANIAFDDRIDRGAANYLVRTARELSYRQLCLLAIVAAPAAYGLVEEQLPVQLDYAQGNAEVATIPPATLAVLNEAFELLTRGVVALPFQRLAERADLLVVAELRLPPAGRQLYDLMELAALDAADLEEVAALVRASTAPS